MMSHTLAKMIQKAAPPPDQGTASGYDYDNQAWFVDGRYIACGHPQDMDCQCFGRIHAGELVRRDIDDDRHRVSDWDRECQESRRLNRAI